MHLKSLTTTHFKKLGSQEFLFGPGLNVIAGDNAFGKSTLLQAIEAAFFGATVIPGKAEHIATWGQKKWALELHFEVDNQHYVINRNASTAKLQRLSGQEAELVANGTTPVKAAVEELLGLSAKDYNLFIQSKQGESTGILTFGAAALNRKVEDYAGVEMIEKVQGAAQIKATRLSASADAKRVPAEVLQQAELDLAKATEGAGEAQDIHTAAKEKLEAFGEFTLPVVEDTTVAMRQEMHAADLLQAKVASADLSVIRAEKALNTAQSRVNALPEKDAAGLLAERDEAKARGVELGASLASIRTQKSMFALAQGSVEQAAAALKKAEGAVLPLADVASVAIAEANLDAAEEASTAAVTTTTEASVKVRNLKMMTKDSTCPTCGHAKADHDPAKLASELEEAEKAYSVAFEASNAANKALAEAKAAVKAYEEQDRAAQASLDAVEAAEQKLKKAQAELAELTAVDDSQIHDLEVQLDTLREEYAALNAQVGQVEEYNKRVRDERAALAQAQALYDDAHALAAELNAKLEELPEPPTEEEVAEVQAKVEAFRAAQAQWKFEHGNLSMDEKEAAASVRIAQQAFTAAQGAVERLVAQNTAADSDAALGKRYDRLVRFLREGRQGYMQQVWSTILAVSSRIVADSSRGMITRILNEDGEFSFEEDGILAPCSSASGAQRSFIGTSLRIGLGRALYGSDSLLIFDEPTEACSEQNASAMAATLASSAKQVLLITHRETDQVLAERIINVGA